jgi:glycosyltransferase involved in cell wall biosynthesis
VGQAHWDFAEPITIIYSKQTDFLRDSVKIIYISWAENCSRSDNTARELGGKSFMIYWGGLGSNPVTIVLKYLGQSFSTLRLLLREQPEAVFIMSPPVIAVLPVYFCTLLKRIPFVIDSHTAAYLMLRWKHFQWLQRWLERKAATTIVHNEYLAGIVRQGGGHATIVRHVPVSYHIDEKFPLNGTFSVATVCSFNYDEPVDQILEAARELNDVRFYMTGNPKFLDPKHKSDLPENVQLTGFLSDSAYGSLVQNANAVMALTTRNHTMLRAAYEAIYQETPVIVSDWPLLRESFDRGTVHVDNSAESIVWAVRTLQAHYDKFKQEAGELRARKLEEWEKTRKSILERIRKK